MKIQFLKKSDIDEMILLQENVDESFFNKRNKENFESVLENGFCLGVKDENKIIAYSRVLFDIPDKRIQSHFEFCPYKTVSFNGSVIKPDYRGQNIQYKMHQYSLNLLTNTIKKDNALSLVHPENLSSLKNLYKSGFALVDEVEVYEGKKRFLMYKDIK